MRTEAKPHGGATPPVPLFQRFNLGALFFISGAVALVYEGIWQRQFTLLFGSSSPATAAVLAAYFAGMALGAFVVGMLASRWRKPLRDYAGLELLIAVGAHFVSPIVNVYETRYPQFFQQ